MTPKNDTELSNDDVLAELEEARETLRALKYGHVDALVVTGDNDEDKIVALLSNDKLAQSIFEQSAEAIIVCDTAGTIVKASEAAHEICGVNPLLQPLNFVLPLRIVQTNPNSAPRYFDIAEVLRGLCVKGMEIEFSAKGRTCSFLLSAAPLKGPSAEVTGCVVMLTDITALKTAQEQQRAAAERERELRMQLQAASDLRDDIMAVISHELRTPLMAILGWAQILQRVGPEDTEKLQTGLRTIDRNARHQSRIVEDLLDMSRIISGKLRLDIALVNINRVITDVVESMNPSAESKNLTIEYVPCTPDPYVNGDAARLQQVIYNVVSNAVKFTPQDGSIKVVVERTGGDIEICVTDSGMGISPEFLPHVFERFRQADSSTTRKTTGIGLGLAIVRSIVELHQGTISAHSEGLGKGATFKIRLALAANAPK